MDNFGILKLLGSFLSAMKNSAENKSQNESGAVAPENAEQNENATQKNIKKNPLSGSLLKTCAEHDEFVKRVYKSNKKTP